MIGEIDDIICHGPIAKPSSIVPGTLKRQLAGDLDTIVLKALRKEPERRYATVEQFSEDDVIEEEEVSEDQELDAFIEGRRRPSHLDED